jgi:hypothetical protein
MTKVNWEGSVTTILPAIAGEPSAPAEGEVARGEPGRATKFVAKYKSSSNAAEAFNFSIPTAFMETGGEEPPPLLVQFFNASESVSAATLNASWKLALEKLEFKFTTHAVAPLKKGEVLTVVVAY